MKLQAKDLMVGDYVRVVHLNKIGRIYRVDAVNGHGNEYAALLDDDFNCKDLEPILLSPEILEKNGASKSKLMGEQCHFEYCLNSFMLLAIYDADFSFQINGSARKIKYVHELQHALKLCGITKDIII